MTRPEDVLKRHWGYDAFRGPQRAAIDAVVTGNRDVLVVMATGGGKSLCMQVTFYHRGVGPLPGPPPSKSLTKNSGASGVPGVFQWGSRGVPVGFQGGSGGVQGCSRGVQGWGVPGGSRGVPGGSRGSQGVPGGFQGVPGGFQGACLWRGRGAACPRFGQAFAVSGRPRHHGFSPPVGAIPIISPGFY